jgi:DMSO reductase anchor subunit
MSGSNVSFSELPLGVLIAVGALVLVQLGLQVTALVQLARITPDRVALGGRKWVWAIIIIFGELIGAIVWFAAGKTPVRAIESGSAAAGVPERQQAVDALYGRDGDDG